MDRIIDGETVNDIYLSLLDVCDHDENIELLNEYERTILLTQELANEVNNGGFAQFFDNSSGRYYRDIVQAFTNIGAVRTAALCKIAVSVFGDAMPVDWEERRAFLDKYGELAEPYWEKCDDLFYKTGEDLDALNAAYIQKNIEHFTLTVEDL